MLDDEEQNDDQSDEMPTKRVKTKSWIGNEEVRASDEPTRNSQIRIKRECDLADQTEDDQLSEEPIVWEFTSVQREKTTFDCYDFSDLIRKNQSRVKKESDAL